MRFQKMMFLFVVLLLLVPLQVAAADFAWMKDFNARAEANPQEFRTKLVERFHVNDEQINVVISAVSRFADVYMIFRLGEMSFKPTRYVLDQYKSNQGKGWGVMAKRLGIKPGSKEFHALKRGDDLYTINGKGKGKGKAKR